MVFILQERISLLYKMIKKIINIFIVSKRKDVSFIIFFTFIVTFLIARMLVHLIMINYLPEWLMLNINGVHIHHLTYGIILLSVAGFLALIDENRKHLYKISILYGIGLGLSFDEFGMWLHLEDNYWMRTSYDAIIVLCALFLNIIYFDFFWRKIGKVIYISFSFTKNKIKHHHARMKNYFL